MPGHNHYPWCTCGWCLNYGLGREVGTNIISYFDRYSALRFLERHGALRSGTACFLNPNATCPVCDAKVFYYQNAHGSSVFFDELGPPWPKHPCTNNSQNRPRTQEPDAPQRRSRGLMLELIDATRKIQPSEVALRPDDTGTDAWTLMEAIEIARTGWKNFVVAEFIGSVERKWLKLDYDSAEPTMAIGDVFSLKTTTISLFDIRTMKPRNYIIRILDSNTNADIEKSG